MADELSESVFDPRLTIPSVKVRLLPIVKSVPSVTEPKLVRATVIDESVRKPLTKLSVPSAPVPPMLSAAPDRSPFRLPMPVTVPFSVSVLPFSSSKESVVLRFN